MLTASSMAGMIVRNSPPIRRASVLHRYRRWVQEPRPNPFLVSIAENKLSGFPLLKVLKTINILSVAAYSVEGPWQFGAGIVPA